MAKRNNSKQRTARTPQRVASAKLLARKPSPRTPLSERPALHLDPPVAHSERRPDLRPVEDRRRFHPQLEHAPPLTVHGQRAPVIVRDKARVAKTAKPARRASQAALNRFGPKQHSQTKAILAFALPKKTVICVRRQSRREVLAAKGRFGGGKRSPRRNAWSSISC